MTDINSELIKFNGKTGPQVLDTDDQSGGIDGTMIPTTKEMIDNSILKAELELIKAQQQQILDRLNQPIDTQLTGSFVEKEVVMERAIKQSGFHSANYEQPKGSIGGIFILTVYGVTGTFASGEGYKLETFMAGPDSARWYGYSHEYMTQPSTMQVTEWAPGVQDDKSSSGAISYKGLSGYFVSRGFVTPRIRIHVTGDFADGEGIDCEITAIWI